MKTTQKQSASKTTKPTPKVQKSEPHYSLVGVENAESIKGRALLMNGEETATILAHIRKT